jgi:hypothetical protein
VSEYVGFEFEKFTKRLPKVYHLCGVIELRTIFPPKGCTQGTFGKQIRNIFRYSHFLGLVSSGLRVGWVVLYFFGSRELFFILWLTLHGMCYIICIAKERNGFPHLGHASTLAGMTD